MVGATVVGRRGGGTPDVSALGERTSSSGDAADDLLPWDTFVAARPIAASYVLVATADAGLRPTALDGPAAPRGSSHSASLRASSSFTLSTSASAFSPNSESPAATTADTPHTLSWSA